jgi:hypothetical protein
MRRLLMVCFTVLCVSLCGNAEEKGSGSPSRSDSIADRLLAVEGRLAALEGRPAQQLCKVTAQAVVDKGETCLIVLDSRPKEAVYVVQVPYIEVREDGQGGEIKVRRLRPEQRLRTCNVLEKALPRRYRVSGNKNLLVMDETGRTLSDKEVIEALAEPAVVFEVNENPDPELLGLAGSTLVLVWKDDAARAASELPDIAEQGTSSPTERRPTNCGGL